jgi:hypothetical protein
MNQLANLWSGFKLSLHGRIAVSKTFLISQCTYFGEILTPSAAQLKLMQEITNNYVLRGVPWSKDKLYNKPEEGGLGLIHIGNLLDGLKCSWFARIRKNGVNDNWKINMCGAFFLDPIRLRPGCIETRRPLQNNILSSFWTFCMKFWLDKKIYYLPQFLTTPYL